MFIFFPIRTDSPVRRQPVVNIALIVLNVAAFLVTDTFSPIFGRGMEEFRRRCMLDPQALELPQFITYQFLHGDHWHLLGNMVFLWVFGNSVCSKMGNAAYLLFYLAGGVFAGVGFALLDAAPCIGASGAIAAVTTAYLVLFPRSEVTIAYWLWLYFGSFHVQALLLIGVKIILFDNVIAPQLTPGDAVVSVAHSAHLAGYVFGFIVALAMLAVRALPRDHFDILSLWKRALQRAQMRSALADPNAAARAQLGRVAAAISPETGRPIEDDAAAPDEHAAARVEISELLSRGEYEAAARRYDELIARAPGQCLSPRQMLLIANQFAATQRHSQAAAAYETLLRNYPSVPDAEQVRLMLGIIYARYLQQYEPARRHLEACAPRLANPDLREQAAHWLAVAQAAVGGAPAAQ